MIRLVADENFHGDVVRGLIRWLPELDIVRVQDAGLARTDDPVILEWAARERRVLLTHDVNTMLGFARQRVSRGLPMPGLIAAPRGIPIGRMIEDVHLIAVCSDDQELEGRVVFLPL